MKRFIDYNKAFDKVKHDTVLKMLRDVRIGGNVIRIIINLKKIP